MAKMSAKENWIGELQKTKDWYIVLHDLGHLTPQLVRETVDKVFGEKKIYVIPHGTVIVLHHIWNYENQPDGRHRKHSTVEYQW